MTSPAGGILIQGYLLKEGKRLHGWSKRWFVVHNDGWLCCYKTTSKSSSERTKKVIDLEQCVVQDQIVQVEDRHHIVMTTMRREYRLASKDRAEICKWLAYIQMACDGNASGRRQWNAEVQRALSLPADSAEQISAILLLPTRAWDAEWQACCGALQEGGRKPSKAGGAASSQNNADAQLRQLCRLNSLQRQFRAFTRIAAKVFMLWQARHFGNNNHPDRVFAAPEWFKRRHGLHRSLQSVSIGGVLFEISSDWASAKILRHELRAIAVARHQISSAPSFATNNNGAVGCLRAPLATGVECCGR
jgi:hypothetical protein